MKGLVVFVVVAAVLCRAWGVPVAPSLDPYDLEEIPDGLEKQAPTLLSLIRLAKRDPAALVQEIESSPLAAIQEELEGHPMREEEKGKNLPIVVAHGMGDSCFNGGMKSITETAGNFTGSYAVCIPTGKNRILDTINGFLMSMEKSVDVFAQKVREDKNLANGFNAFGLSQGNAVIRGYISKYNDPPVHTFMSVCGVNAGVAAFPNCSPKFPVVGKVCEALTEALGSLAYFEFIQNHLFQADYFRDPLRLNSTLYLKNSQLAKWNNENGEGEIYRDNFLRTSKFVWVKGTRDTVVWPREGEWWGAPSVSHPFEDVDTMNNTRWYKEDLFGLKQADQEGRNAFEEFKGEHIRFTQEELLQWLGKYFVN